MVRRQHLSLVGDVAWYVNAFDGEKAVPLSGGDVAWYVNASDGEKAAPLSGGGRSVVRQCF